MKSARCTSFTRVDPSAVDDILPSSPPSLSPSNPFNWRIFVHSRIEVRRVARHFPPDTRHGSKDDEPPCRPSSHHGRGASLAAARLVAHITCTPRIRRSNLTCDSESSRPTASAIVAVRHQHVHRVRGVVGPPGLQGGEQRAARGTACRAVGAGGGARGGVRPAELEPGAGVDQAARARCAIGTRGSTAEPTRIPMHSSPPYPFRNSPVIRTPFLVLQVSLPVVRRFVREVTERAVGVEVIRGVRPEQQLVKVVNDQLVALMGGNVAEIAYAPEGKGPTVVLMAGLQGVGKTTACGKLALFLKKKGKTSMMVATDVYRPAAIEQLQTLGAQVGVPVYAEGTDARPVDIARQGVAAAKKAGVDVVIVDTAGRLQIDRSMMEELRGIKAAVSPTEVLLVVDAMTGQEAASLVAAFNAEVSITGAILTKVDGDSRGGAALSVKEVSGRPIKFVGEGETMSALEPFYPDRMASRILGMGDVLSLVEKAQELMDKEDEAELRKRIMEAKFDFNDMLKQTRMMARMGSMGGMLKLIPGMNKVSPHRTALHPPPALHPQFHTSAVCFFSP
ncbi:unnamed protein product [Closterium sp. NIES-54]